jgi:hypothetical protein
VRGTGGLAGSVGGGGRRRVMAKRYTVAGLKEISESERRVRMNEAEKRVTAEAKRNAKLWGKPAAATAGLAAFKFTGKK